MSDGLCMIAGVSQSAVRLTGARRMGPVFSKEWWFTSKTRICCTEVRLCLVPWLVH